MATKFTSVSLRTIEAADDSEAAGMGAGAGSGGGRGTDVEGEIGLTCRHSCNDPGQIVGGCGDSVGIDYLETVAALACEGGADADLHRFLGSIRPSFTA
jgi:hypothetical protein